MLDGAEDEAFCIIQGGHIMHPIDHYETIRRGHEELLRRAEYEKIARKAKIEQRMNRNIHRVANWLSMHLVSWGAKLEKFGTFAER